MALERVTVKYRGVEQLVARRAHNPKVVGSSPSSATKSDTSIDTIVSIEVSSFYRYFVTRIQVNKPNIKTSVAV